MRKLFIAALLLGAAIPAHADAGADVKSLVHEY